MGHTSEVSKGVVRPVEGASLASPEASRPGYERTHIEVLEPWEAIRKRPGMYVGDVHDGTGLEHLVWELVANALDQHLAGFVRWLSVAVEADGTIEVSDDGHGISLRRVERGVTFCEDVLTRWHSSPTRDEHFPHVHVAPSMHGVGLFPVVALSEWFGLDTVHEGQRGRIELGRGVVREPMRIEASSRRSGTSIRFRPDPTIFTSSLDLARVEARLRELAWLLPMLDLRWCGETLPGRGGLFTWVRALGAGDDGGVGGPVFATKREIEGVEVSLALGWAPDDRTEIRSYVNYQRSVRGTHVTGLFEGLRDIAATKGIARTTAEIREAMAPGLRAVVHVGLLDPSFGAPTREHLVSPVAAVATRAALVEGHEEAKRMRGSIGTVGSRVVPPLEAKLTERLAR